MKGQADLLAASSTACDGSQISESGVAADSPSNLDEESGSVCHSILLLLFITLYYNFDNLIYLADNTS